MAAGDMAFFSKPSSSAVKIVAPSAEEPPSPKPKKDSTQRQCRNILIYGSCKYQDKGCIYYHPPRNTSSPVPPESPVPSAALPAEAVNAPVFVPKTSVSGSTASPSPLTPGPIQRQESDSSSAPSELFEHDPNDPYYYNNADGGDSHFDEQAEPTSIHDNPYTTDPEVLQMLDYDAAAMDAFYSASSTFIRQPINYHIYTQPRPESLVHRYFISDSLREELQKRSEAIYTAPMSSGNLPEEAQGYHTFVPLEPVLVERRKFGNWYSTVYRATSSSDGAAYALRRVENYRLTHQSAFAGIEAWSHIRHPGIISVHEAFTTRAFSDSSLVVVYDYHPNSQTLYEAHIKPKPPQFQHGRLQAQIHTVPERTMWSYIVQLASAIKAVHDAGMAVRIMDATKILVTGKNRVRISSCGVVDVLLHEARQDILMLQQEDLALFGKLIFALCCNNLAAMNNLPKAVDTVTRQYSNDLKNVALFLISKATPHKTIGRLFDMLGGRVLTELNEMQNAVDCYEGELMSELENGRLVRLLCKFGFINERPEFGREPRWSETGDRYIVKLFRDYVFHQVDEHDNPVVNLTHVLTCLNKLDAGSEERIMLVSRDEQSCLVVSYRDVKTCIESSLNDLIGAYRRFS